MSGLIKHAWTNFSSWKQKVFKLFKVALGESREEMTRACWTHMKRTGKYEQFYASLLSSFRAESNKRYISDEKNEEENCNSHNGFIILSCASLCTCMGSS